MNDLRLIKDIQIMYNKEVFLWGAGKVGRECADYLAGSNMNILGFCDTNEQLKGSYVKGYRVFSKKEIADKISENADIVVVITADCLEPIHQQVLEMGVNADNIFSKFALYYTILQNINCTLVPEGYREKFKRDYKRWKFINHKRADYRFSFKYYAYNWDKIIQKNPVVVYQPGKVASSTLTNSVTACGLEAIQTHALAFRNEFMDKEMENLYQEFKYAMSEAQSVKVISAVREPIMRDISHIFEHINLPFVELYEDFDNDLLQSVQECIEKNIVKRIENWEGMSPTLIHHLLRINGGLFQWFERELKEVYGINILDYPFERGKGYTIIKKGNVELFVFKMEKLNQLEEVLGKFLGVDNFHIISTNLSANKDYRYAYKQVLDTIKLPESYIDMYYKNNIYMDYFYTEEEKEKFLKKWLER